MKRRKTTAKAKADALAEKAMLDKWDKLPKFARQPHKASAYRLEYKLLPPPGRETPQFNSHRTPGGSTQTVNNQQYTGTAMLGVGVLHKSALVPIFSSEEATELARMRR